MIICICVNFDSEWREWGIMVGPGDGQLTMDTTKITYYVLNLSWVIFIIINQKIWAGGAGRYWNDCAVRKVKFGPQFIIILWCVQGLISTQSWKSIVRPDSTTFYKWITNHFFLHFPLLTNYNLKFFFFCQRHAPRLNFSCRHNHNIYISSIVKQSKKVQEKKKKRLNNYEDFHFQTWINMQLGSDRIGSGQCIYEFAWQL